MGGGYHSRCSQPPSVFSEWRGGSQDTNQTDALQEPSPPLSLTLGGLCRASPRCRLGPNTVQPSWARGCPWPAPAPGCPCRPLPSGYRPQHDRSRHGGTQMLVGARVGRGRREVYLLLLCSANTSIVGGSTSYRQPLCEVSVPGSVCPVELDSVGIPALSPPRWAWESGVRCYALVPSPETKSLQHFVTTLPNQGA